MTYDEALRAGRKTGMRRCSDAELMAAFCDGDVQILLGAVSPKLIWEGAQAKGMTTQELVTLIHDDPMAAVDLMWFEGIGPNITSIEERTTNDTR